MPHTQLEWPEIPVPSLEIIWAEANKVSSPGYEEEASLPVGLCVTGSSSPPPPVGLHCPTAEQAFPWAYPSGRTWGITQPYTHVHTNTSAHTHIFQPLKENKLHERHAYFKLIPWGIFRPKMPQPENFVFSLLSKTQKNSYTNDDKYFMQRDSYSQSRGNRASSSS